MIFSIMFVISDILGNPNIFTTKNGWFQQNLPDKSRENGKNTAVASLYH